MTDTVRAVRRPTWDETWMEVALAMARRSMCDRAKVGAVIVTPTNRLVSSGYNGPPAGMRTKIKIAGRSFGDPDCLYDCPRRQKPTEELDPGYTDCITVHAELNALAYCDRSSAEGGSMYCTGMLCHGCAKVVANSGLARVVLPEEALHRETHRDPVALDLLRECGLRVDLFVPYVDPIEAVRSEIDEMHIEIIDRETHAAAMMTGQHYCDFMCPYVENEDGDEEE